METVINVENLRKSYGNNSILNDISFSVKKGNILGLLGANGAGKTTTIECILGTKKADSGAVSILGKNPAKSRPDLFQKIGVQFQDSSYQEKIQVGELCNVTASLYKKPQDFNQLLNKFSLGNKVNSSVKKLSGGERQRLFIVLALIPNPDVIFFDELTTGLDPKARRDVWEILLDLKSKGLTMLITSHFMDEVEVLCDYICILNNGEFIFQGTVKNAIISSGCTNFEEAYIQYTKEDN